MVRIRGYSEDDVDFLTEEFERIVAASLAKVAVSVGNGLQPAIIGASSAGLGPEDIGIVTTLWQDEIDGVLLPYIGEVYSGSAVHVALGLSDGFPSDELPGIPLVADEYTTTYMKSVSNRLVGVGDELWEDVRNELLDGVKEGKSIDQIAARIVQVANFSKQRSTVIARTEIHSAAESGSVSQLRYVGYKRGEVTKIWESTHDLRTRLSHVAADGQRVDMNDMFSVGGASLDYPGDPGGPADEIIQCRCTTLFEIDEEPELRCVPTLIAASPNDQQTCIVSTPPASIAHLLPNVRQIIFNSFMKTKISPAYGGAKIHKTLKDTQTDLEKNYPVIGDLVNERQILAVVDSLYTAKKDTFGGKFVEWEQTPTGKKALMLNPFKTPAKGVSTSSSPNVSPVIPQIGLSPPTEKHFKILDDPGKSGDGYIAPGGPWGKYGASGVLVRAVDDVGVPRFLLIQRGTKYIGSQQLKWQLPGGGMDELETPYNGAARELWEETSPTKEWVESMTPLGEMVYNGPHGWKYTSIVAHAHNTFTPIVHGSTGDAKWFTLDEIHEMIENDDIVKELELTLGQLTDQLDALAKPLETELPTTLPPIVGKPIVSDIHYTGVTLGSHGAQVWENSATGDRWLFKPQLEFLTDLDVGLAKLQSKAKVMRPSVYKVTLNGKSGSLQYMFKSKDAWPGGSFYPGKLTPDEVLILQREQIFDWMISNHDTHTGQWIRLEDGQIYGTDKGQAFKFFPHDKLDWTYIPVTPLGNDKLTYTAMWKRFVSGNPIPLQNPTEGQLGEFIDRLMNVPDEMYRALLTPYASAVKKTKLELDTFLDAAVVRKNALRADFTKFWQRASDERAKNVTPVNKPTHAPTPKPSTIVAQPPIVPTTYVDVTKLTSTDKENILTKWITVGGGKKVTPAWGGAKVYKQVQAMKLELKDTSYSKLSTLELVRVLDDAGGFIGKKKTYENEVVSWAQTPNGMKALAKDLESEKSFVKPTPFVAKNPTPVSSPADASVPEDVAILNTGEKKTMSEIWGSLTKYEVSDVVAYVKTSNGKTLKMIKSINTSNGDPMVLVHMRNDSPGEVTWTHVSTYHSPGKIFNTLWSVKPPTTIVLSKIPGKAPNDFVTLVEIQESKYAWSTGDIVAESVIPAKLRIISVGKGKFKVEVFIDDTGKWNASLLTLDDIKPTIQWKLTGNTLVSKSSPSVIPGKNTGDLLSTVDVFHNNMKGAGVFAYAWDADTGLIFRAQINGVGQLTVRARTPNESAWSLQFHVSSHNELEGKTWYASDKNGSMPDVVKVQIPGASVPGVAKSSYIQNINVGESITHTIDINNALFVPGTDVDGNIFATGVNDKNIAWRIIYHADTGELHAEFKDVYSNNWIDAGNWDPWNSHEKTSVKTWIAAFANDTPSKMKGVETKKPASTQELTGDDTHIPNIKVGDDVTTDVIYAYANKYVDGQVIATRVNALGNQMRVFMVDGHLIRQHLTKAGTWTQTTIIESDNYWDPLSGDWKDANLSAQNLNWKAANLHISAQSLKTVRAFIKKQKGNVSVKPSVPSAPVTPLVPSAPVTPSNLPVVDITPWNATEQKEMYSYFRKKKAHSNSNNTFVWQTLQETKSFFQAKYGGKYAQLNVIKLLRIIDALYATEKVIPNKHQFELKITQWLKTPSGKQYVSMRIDAPLATSDIPAPMNDFAAGGDMDEQSYAIVTKAESLNNRDISHTKYGQWTSAQRAALRKYTDNVYSTWNAAIRSGNLSVHKREIINAQQGMRPSVRPMLLHRKVGFTEFNENSIVDYATLKKHEGETYVNRGFNSTSYGATPTWSGALHIEIEAPIGTPMAHVQDISLHPSEKEVLLATHLVYKIIRVTKETYGTTMRVRVIGVAKP